MKVLITGAYGFVGVNLVRRFASSGHDVVAVDLSAADGLTERFLSGHWERVHSIVGSINDEGFEERVPPQIDLVVHAAAVTPLGPGEESARSVEAVSVNVVGSARIMRAAKALGAKRVVYVSSGSVYGPNRSKATLGERTPSRPSSVYGITKCAAELIVRRVGALEGLQTIVVRLAQPYGPMERPTASRHLLSPVHDWCHAGLRREPLLIQNGDLARDYTHIDDVVEVLYRLAAVKTPRYDTYNVGSGVDTTLAALMEVVLLHFPGARTATGGSSYLSGAVARAPLNPSRAMREADWHTFKSIEVGIAAYVRWLTQDPSHLVDSKD